MALYKGNTKIKSLYLGGTKIQKLYKGSTLVYSSGYPSGTVLFENATAGSYTLNVLYDATITVDLVGAGSGACYNVILREKGGSGAYISGTTTITAGTYTVVIGAGSAGATGTSNTISAGGNSTFNGNTAGGAPSWTPKSGSSGGTASVSSSGLSGQNGSGQNSTGWISGYGAGGNTTKNQAATIKGKDGYCKITVA